MAVAVVGGINVDLFALVDRQPDDDHPSLITQLATGPGGKGANQAVVAARLGADVQLLGAVGDDDEGHRAVGAIAAAGVRCDSVRVCAGARTGAVVGTVTSAGSKRTAAIEGANGCLTVADIAAFEPSIAAADVVLCQLEPPPEVVRAVLEAAAALGVPALLDIAPAQGPVRDLVPLARWITGNRSEVEVATGIRVHDEASARRAAIALRAAGPAICGVTVGALGQLVSAPDGDTWCEIDRSIPVVDTAGAGDAFAATLGVALAEGVAPSTAARYAARASTLACRTFGAQAGLATREELGWS